MLQTNECLDYPSQSWKKNVSERFTVEQRQAIACEMRLKMLEMWQVNRAPLSGAYSIVELYVEFFLNQLDLLNYVSNPQERVRIVPKATSALAFYQVLGFAGLVPGTCLAQPTLETFPPVIHRRIGSEFSIFKLGGNLEQAMGIALAGKLQQTAMPVVAFVGDGELQTGIDHQAKFAAQMKLDNLTIIVDCNGLQSDYQVEQADHTFLKDTQGCLRTQCSLWELYGWHSIEIDGHDFEQIERAMDYIGRTDKPLIILAKTAKGKGISLAERRLGYNHKMSDDEFEFAHEELLRSVQKNRQRGHFFAYPEHCTPVPPSVANPKLQLPSRSLISDRNLEITLAAWLNQLISLNPGQIVVLNTDNPRPFSTHTPIYKPGKDSFLVFAGCNEHFALNLARGMANAALHPIYVSPATHLMINGEEWKLAAMDRQPVLLIGRTPGSELWRWGQSHLAYEDVERFRTRNATIYQPATTEDLLIILQYLYEGNMHGPVYLRLPEIDGVSADPKLYDSAKKRCLIVQHGFYVIKSNIHPDQGADAFVTLVASGDLVRECLWVAEKLEMMKIAYKVINVVDLSDISQEAFRATVKGSLVIITAIDALPESLAHVIYKVLPSEDRSKVETLGIVEEMPTPIPIQTIYQNNRIDSESILRLVENKLSTISCFVPRE